MRTYRAPSPEALAAHLAALRLIATHRPLLSGGAITCVGADRCTRRAHWRYFPERNPCLAVITVSGGAVEMYEVVGPDGYPLEGGGYCVLRRYDGPVGRLYGVLSRHALRPDALRAAGAVAIDDAADLEEG